MFFDERTSTEVVEEIVRMDPAIAKAQRRLEAVTGDEEFRHQYLLRQMALSDWTTGVNTAFEKDVAEGIEKGREEGIMRVARNALATGLSVDAVQQLTGLDKETICALPKE